MKNRIITRKTLAGYARALGPASIAAQALSLYDANKAEGRRVEAVRRNSGFTVRVYGRKDYTTHNFG